MAKTFSIDPVSRIEGHLKVEVTVDKIDNVQQVIDAKSSGTMFRGFEKILIGHDAYDAPHITQRICGVCPVSHGMASCMTLEDAFDNTPPANGRILRNLILGANFIQSHVLHFYHLAALDYINTEGILDMAPWAPRYTTPDLITGTTAQMLVDHYLQALVIRRKAHQMGAIWGGKLPAPSSFMPGGCLDPPETGKISQFRNLLNEIKTFVDDVFIPDTEALAAAFPEYFQVGVGSGKLLSYGVFDLNQDGSSKLLGRGKYNGSSVDTVDQNMITEDVKYSWYASHSGLHPSDGVTEPNANKPNAYSWVKAPRYNGDVYELGPLARMWVNGDYTNGISTMDRIAARTYETQKIAYAMDGWLNELSIGGVSYIKPTIPSNPDTLEGVGLTEAPRGALGHWVTVNPYQVTHDGHSYTKGKILRYQVITPTAWNASPKDDAGIPGAMEQALVGTPVADTSKPVEILRVIHSFDPCLACSVHMLRPDKEKAEVVMNIPGGL